MKLKFAVVSRHAPTSEQHQLANEQGIELDFVGDADAFHITSSLLKKNGEFDGVVVVHPAAAMRLCGEFLVGVFENANRAPLGEKPQFFARSFHVYDMR